MQRIQVHLQALDGVVTRKNQFIFKTNHTIDLIVVKVAHYMEYEAATTHLAVAALRGEVVII